MESLRGGMSEISGAPKRVVIPEAKPEIRLIVAIVATLVLLWLAPREYQQSLITASLLGILGLIWPTRISKQTDNNPTEHYLHPAVRLSQDFQRKITQAPAELHLKWNIITAKRMQMRTEEALTLTDDYILQSKRLLGEDHPVILAAYDEKATMLSEALRSDDSVRLARHNLERVRTVYPQPHPWTVTTAFHLGNILSARQEFKEASLQAKLAVDTVETLDDLGGGPTIGTPDLLFQALMMFFDSGQLQECFDLFEKVRHNSEHLHDGKMPAEAELCLTINRARVLCSLGNLEEPMKIAVTAQACLENPIPSLSGESVIGQLARTMLANLYMELCEFGRWESCAWHNREQKQYEETLREPVTASPMIQMVAAQFMVSYARSKLQSKEYTRSTQLTRLAIPVLERLEAAPKPLLHWTYFQLAIVFCWQYNWIDAEELSRQVYQQFSETYGHNSRGSVITSIVLGFVLMNRAKFESAIQVLTSVIHLAHSISSGLNPTLEATCLVLVR
jgi:tetratricopeptide (TPR) repeat protein